MSALTHPATTDVELVAVDDTPLDEPAAEALTQGIVGRIGDLHERLAALHGEIVRAYRGQAHVALGYGSGQRGWDAYCRARLGALRELRLADETRLDLVRELSAAGLSTRGQGSVLNRSDQRIRTDQGKLREAGQLGEAEGRVRGVDGRSYSARSTRRVDDDVVDAEVVEVEVLTVGPAVHAAPAPAGPVLLAHEESGSLRPVSKVATLLDELLVAGPAGLTSLEVTRAHLGQVGWDHPWAMLSRLHTQRRVARLAETRDGHAVYVLARESLVGGRPTEEPGRRTRRAG